MEPVEYQRMAQYEDTHWWFSGKRSVIAALIRRMRLPNPARILEVGCGTGGNLAMLAKSGIVDAVEMDKFARNHAASRNIAKRILPAQLPQEMPYKDEAFDLIAMFDVLEHIEDDAGSLRVLRDLLAPLGQLCLTVPALPFLWSSRDVANHHKRRYTFDSLRKLITGAGFRIEYISYYNFWLAPLIIPATLLQKLIFGVRSSEASILSMPPTWINNTLKNIFASERFFIGRFRPPFGISLILSARRVEAI